MEVPDSGWSKWVSLHVPVCSNSSSVAQDSLLLIRLISLVVPTQGDSNDLELSTSCWNFLFPGECCPGVTNIGAEDLVTDNQNTYTCRPRKPEVDSTVLVESLGDSCETLVELFLHLC